MEDYEITEEDILHSANLSNAILDILKDESYFIRVSTLLSCLEVNAIMGLNANEIKVCFENFSQIFLKKSKKEYR